MGTKSHLEQQFQRAWEIYCPYESKEDYEPVTEYRFSPPRRWRFDFAFPDRHVAVEVEGGTWINGRHSRGSGMSKDAEKYNEAAAQGWRVLRFTSDMMYDDPAGCILSVMRALQWTPERV